MSLSRLIPTMTSSHGHSRDPCFTPNTAVQVQRRRPATGRGDKTGVSGLHGFKFLPLSHNQDLNFTPKHKTESRRKFVSFLLSHPELTSPKSLLKRALKILN